jgi:hypothetical protein
MARRPIAAVLDDPDLIVVCDDGTVWNYSRGSNEWNRLAAIPGSPAVKKEKEREKDRLKAREKAEERAKGNAKKSKETAAIL